MSKLTEVEQQALAVKKAEKENKIKERLLGYSMRELEANDVFKILEIINILNVTDLVNDFLQKKDIAKIKSQKSKELVIVASGKDEKQKEALADQIKDIQEEISAQSFEFVSKAVKFILANHNSIKTELNSLLADLTGKTPEEIGKTNVVTYALLVKDFFLKPELREVFELLS
ncbi:hypothetical protein PML78_04580 [Enterococcus dispar]|uniref:hypothetical protein n=1 Tax=Enterococcus dispar TaxID=44009 RepID=UPI00232C4DB0|nr:hypothetical protein [Enterococcus dispar]WCG33973.1 hypothetical protein PML78_04580 [Enterococcus dispar]